MGEGGRRPSISSGPAAKPARGRSLIEPNRSRRVPRLGGCRAASSGGGLNARPTAQRIVLLHPDAGRRAGPPSRRRRATRQGSRRRLVRFQRSPRVGVSGSATIWQLPGCDDPGWRSPAWPGHSHTSHSCWRTFRSRRAVLSLNEAPAHPCRRGHRRDGGGGRRRDRGRDLVRVLLAQLFGVSSACSLMGSSRRSRRSRTGT